MSRYCTCVSLGINQRSHIVRPVRVTRGRTCRSAATSRVVADFSCFSMSVMLALGAISCSRRDSDQSLGHVTAGLRRTIARVAVGAARDLLDQPRRDQFAQAVLDVGDIVAVAEAAELADAARFGHEHQLLQDDALLAGQLVCPCRLARKPRRRTDRTPPMRRSAPARIRGKPVSRSRAARAGSSYRASPAVALVSCDGAHASSLEVRLPTRPDAILTDRMCKYNIGYFRRSLHDRTMGTWWPGRLPLQHFSLAHTARLASQGPSRSTSIPLRSATRRRCNSAARTRCRSSA